MSETIKPCPACLCVPEVHYHGYGYVSITCVNCYDVDDGRPNGYSKSETNLVDANLEWNAWADEERMGGA